MTSAFHLPRALRLFERQGLRAVPFAVDFQGSGSWAGSPLADPLNWSFRRWPGEQQPRSA